MHGLHDVLAILVTATGTHEVVRPLVSGPVHELRRRYVRRRLPPLLITRKGTVTAGVLATGPISLRPLPQSERAPSNDEAEGTDVVCLPYVPRTAGSAQETPTTSSPPPHVAPC